MSDDCEVFVAGAKYDQVTDRMIADLKLQGADHIAVTGDITNIGMPREHEEARRWLESLRTGIWPRAR